MRRRLALLVPLLAFAPVLTAQSGPLSLTAEMTQDYRSVRDYVLATAEEVPESLYAFKPSPVVRTFAQQFAHIADDQYNLCAPAQGATRNAAYRAIENSLSSKSDIVPALHAAFAYCDSVYAATTDANATTPVAGRPHTRFGMLNWNMWHTWEHYGNLVVYMRLNGLVPPSAMPMPMPSH